MALITSYCNAMRIHEHQMALITSSQVRARLVMQDPSADCPCQEKMPSSWLQVMTVPPEVTTARFTSLCSP